MKQITDLHTHSTASDGQYTPSELVRLARDRGIEALALTDPGGQGAGGACDSRR